MAVGGFAAGAETLRPANEAAAVTTTSSEEEVSMILRASSCVVTFRRAVANSVSKSKRAFSTRLNSCSKRALVKSIINERLVSVSFCADDEAAWVFSAVSATLDDDDDGFVERFLLDRRRTGRFAFSSPDSTSDLDDRRDRTRGLPANALAAIREPVAVASRDDDAVISAGTDFAVRRRSRIA